jgi:hypothetical protein
MSKEIDDLRKRMSNKGQESNNNNDESEDIRRLINLERIRAIDQQAKLYDKTKPVTNRDKGFGDIVGKDGQMNETWQNAKVPSIEERERNYQTAMQQQSEEKRMAFKHIYEQKKQNIFQNMDNILNELDAIDGLLKGL